MVAIRFVPLPPDEYEPWRAALVEEYGQEHVRAGNWTPEEAHVKSDAEIRELIPEGTSTPDHHLYAVEDPATGEHVGMIWFHAKRGPTDGKPIEVFIYDVQVYERFRGRGFGEAAMRSTEDEARALGFDTISLHVFGHNRTARALYDKLGYEPTNIRMTKKLAHIGATAPK